MQSSALPLGYVAKLERETGFEPATLALARRCSTTELLPRNRYPRWCHRAGSAAKMADWNPGPGDYAMLSCPENVVKVRV